MLTYCWSICFCSALMYTGPTSPNRKTWRSAAEGSRIRKEKVLPRPAVYTFQPTGLLIEKKPPSCFCSFRPPFLASVAQPAAADIRKASAATTSMNLAFLIASTSDCCYLCYSPAPGGNPCHRTATKL